MSKKTKKRKKKKLKPTTKSLTPVKKEESRYHQHLFLARCFASGMTPAQIIDASDGRFTLRRIQYAQKQDAFKEVLAEMERALFTNIENKLKCLMLNSIDTLAQLQRDDMAPKVRLEATKTVFLLQDKFKERNYIEDTFGSQEEELSPEEADIRRQCLMAYFSKEADLRRQLEQKKMEERKIKKLPNRRTVND